MRITATLPTGHQLRTRVTCLVLEGEETERLAGALDEILRERGVTERPAP